MSETVHYKGVLKRIKKYEGETLEEQCKRLLENKELPTYFDSYQEYLVDQNYQEITVQNNVVYRVEKETVEQDSGIFKANLKGNGDIEFETRYYNGGCGFNEAIEEALMNIHHKNNKKSPSEWAKEIIEKVGIVEADKLMSAIDSELDKIKHPEDYEVETE